MFSSFSVSFPLPASVLQISLPDPFSAAVPCPFADMCFEQAPCSVVGSDAHGSCQSDASCGLLKPAVTFKFLAWEILTVLNAELWGLWDC